MRFSKDEAVYTSGQRDDRIYLIEEGQVEIVAYSNNGKRCILSVQVEGEVFGELGTIARSRLETARAMGRTVLRVIPAARLQAALDETGLAKDFALHLLNRLHHQERAIANMVMLNSEQRLAVVLLELGRKVGRRHGTELRIEQRITHEDLAAMVGTTRSRIGLFLKAFHAQGFLALNDTPYLSVNERCLERYVSWFAVTPVPFPC
jgi:CRP/FNR family transcriptional regulator, cyclic AMP receptor protein